MQKAINFDDVTTKNKKKKQNSTWAPISDHPYEILIIRSS